MIIRMMYVLPMILGRTYDMRTHTVGVDLFPREDIAQPRVIQESFYNSNFRTIETSADVKEVLDIYGDLSLNIKAGTFTIGGVGAYVKSSVQTQNSVDILVKVRFRTISESLPFNIKPVKMWKTVGKSNLGTHYVQSILYGGDLIACIRFKALNSEDLQEIRATITSSISAGNVLDLVGEGKLESLDRQLKRKATMEINYFATVPLEGVPNTIQGLRDLVKNFKDHVAKVNNGSGVPVEVELVELSNFDREFEYIKNLELETELELFEIYLDDLLGTKNRIQTMLFEYRDILTNEEVREIADISGRVSKILRSFVATIANLDTEKNSQQLNPAKEAYTEGTGRQMPGKFKRLLNKIVKKIAASTLPL
ncbi:uncharacterized protein LOC129957577 [Argiope bruennichi]|uniref:uncharacterized protein LOC129957577 n=1 Tax=Argiope bruennichi TaxID=94029 RepID=UPI002494339F|nr:uncharacterized protein LOC129957577 [Argiope bruennichi]